MKKQDISSLIQRNMPSENSLCVVKTATQYLWCSLGHSPLASVNSKIASSDILNRGERKSTFPLFLLLLSPSISVQSPGNVHGKISHIMVLTIPMLYKFFNIFVT